MNKPRSKVGAILFSLIPGAGQMYLGKMKTGLIMMGSFALMCLAAAVLDFPYILFLLPLVWFYAFFDCLNKCRLTPEELEALPDEIPYLQGLGLEKMASPKIKKWAGWILVFLGSIGLWNTIIHWIRNTVTDNIADSPIFYYLSESLPKVALGVVVVVIGIMLIRGKKKALDEEENEDETDA